MWIKSSGTRWQKSPTLTNVDKLASVFVISGDAADNDAERWNVVGAGERGNVVLASAASRAAAHAIQSQIEHALVLDTPLLDLTEPPAATDQC